MQTGQPLPVTHIGKYRLLAHIATGGMGAVYKARDEELRRVVALKVLPPEMASNPVIVERFRREAAHAAQLQHKNIVSIFENGEASGFHFLAMEFIDGIDLAEYIRRRGTVAPEEARRIVMQACKALDHAFARGITHRDIKPSNFLLANHQGSCRVKLTDLGLSRAVSDEEFRVTRAGTTVGTVDYMSPEQARDSALADVRSDIYSLGCTLYHMLAGHPPFSGGLGERVYKHLAVDPDDVRKFNPEVPAALWTVLRQMLAKHPDDRFQTPAELYQALKSIPEGEEEPPFEVPTVPAGPPPGEDKPLPNPQRPSSEETEVPAVLPVSLPGPTARKQKSLRTRPEATPGRGAESPSGSLTLSPEQRQAAAGQFVRACEVQGGEKPDYALQLLLSCCKLDPTNLEYRRKLRQVGRSANQGKIGWLASLAALPLRGRLRSARGSGDHRKVLEYGEEILLRSPDDVGVQLDMAGSAEALGLNALAVWLLEQARQQQPSPAVLKPLAALYERLSRYSQAIALWEQVRELDPSDTEAAGKIKDLSASDTIARVNRR